MIGVGGMMPTHLPLFHGLTYGAVRRNSNAGEIVGRRWRLRTHYMHKLLNEVTAGKGSELFLFIEDKALRETKPLDAVWSLGRGESAG
ncbi:hypothetical protein [Methylocystis sp.]|uniref:hypothetical protein n=1 Tax=Methylocystis sp. TaxID=1911079 RepID=UPI0025E6C1EA|nr:hypothetical protein [Methylocystis sp.]